MTTFNEMAEQSGKYLPRMKILATLLKETFNIPYFFYIHITKERKCTLLGSNPDLVHHYCDEKMQNTNPLFVKTEEIGTGLCLYDSLDKSDFRGTMQQLEAKYGLKHSFVLIRKNESSTHFYGFTIPSNAREQETLLVNQAPVLKNFCSYFDTKMEPVLQKLAAQPVDLTEHLDPFVKKSSFHVPKTFLEDSKILKFLGLVTGQTLSTPNLSTREGQLVAHLLRGKSASEIGETLGLSTRTIEHYTDNVKNKLGCYSKSELIETLLLLRDSGLLE